MKVLFSSAMFLCLFAPVFFAQDPLKVAPQAYKLAFENEWVRVMHVHYGPREKIPAHDHTQLAAIYVYLNDGGPVIFKHIGLDYGPITRPATKAGSFRIYKAVKEVHEVENTSDMPSDFLRVEFKTRIVDEKTLRGRFYRESWPAGENFERTQFEDEQIRVTRLACAPGKKLDIPSSPTGPALLVPFSKVRLDVVGQKGNAMRADLEPGKTGWQQAGQQLRLESPGNAPAELLRFEFKTEPVKGVDRKGTAHEHPRE